MAAKHEDNGVVDCGKVTEKPQHSSYLNEFRTRQCSDFLQHKCTLHRPFMCFNWHFANQKRRRPVLLPDGTFNYSPDNYCPQYDETTGVCPNGDECNLLHRTLGDTERRYHLRYYKTCPCVHETDKQGNCVKNAQHCPFAHGPQDLRKPVFDRIELQATADEAAGRIMPTSPLNSCLEMDRLLNEDPVWNDPNYVLANYKTDLCTRPLRLCRQGFACPSYHNPRDKRRSPAVFKYRSTPCPSVKIGEEWGDPLKCEVGDPCGYCHTRTEQQFHLEIYKSSKCNDMVQTGYCPRGLFCAFAHVEHEMNIKWDLTIASGSTPLSAFVKLPPTKKTSTDSGDMGGGGGSSGSGEASVPTTSNMIRFDSVTEDKIKSHFLSGGGGGRGVSIHEHGEFSSPAKTDLSLFSSGRSGPFLDSPRGPTSGIGGLPEPIGKGRSSLLSNCGSLNEGYLTNYGHNICRGASLDLDDQQQQQSPFRPSTMSIGSYQQYREQRQQQQLMQLQQQELHIHLQQQLQQLRLQQQQQADQQLLSQQSFPPGINCGNKSAASTSYQPYSLVERQILSDYLSNNAAPPKSESSGLPSTFFNKNETLESVVGTVQDDDLDINLDDLNSALDRELDSELGSLSDTFNASLGLSSSMGSGSFIGDSSLPMMIPRDGQRHHSVGSIGAVYSVVDPSLSGFGVPSNASAMYSSPSRLPPQHLRPERLTQQQHQMNEPPPAGHNPLMPPSTGSNFYSGGLGSNPSGDFSHHNFYASLLASGPQGSGGSGGPLGGESQSFGLGGTLGGAAEGCGDPRRPDDVFQQARIGMWEDDARQQVCEAWMKEAQKQQLLRILAEEDRNRVLSQVAELNNEVKLLSANAGASFDYQQHISNGYPAPNLMMPRPPAINDYRQMFGTTNQCAMCHTQPSTVLVQPCNHCALCYTCASRADDCPLCRQAIAQKIPIGTGQQPGIVAGGGGGIPHM